MTATERFGSVPDLTDFATFSAAVPFELFDELQRQPGLYWQPAAWGTLNGGFWVVTRFDDIVEIEKNPELFTSTRGAAFPGTNLEPGGHMEDQMMHMDPPRHSAVRRSAAASFGPRVVAHFDAWVRDIVVEVLESAQALGQFDWVTEVAAIIPSRVIARVMGVPASDRELIVDLTNRSFAAQQLQDDNFVTQGQVVGEMINYIATTLEEDKRKNPQDDMTTVLMEAVARGDITEAESRHFLLLLIAAGYETTHTMMGQSMRMMLENPELEQDARKAITELGADKVAEEFLRLITPAMNMARTATRDTVLSGQEVRKGDCMQMYFIAANRDPAVFKDPHRFNPWRTEGTSLAFGSGAHRCMGNSLAKLELRILFEELDKRGIRLKLDGEPKRGRSVFINQLTSLPVSIV